MEQEAETKGQRFGGHEGGAEGERPADRHYPEGSVEAEAGQSLGGGMAQARHHQMYRDDLEQ